MNEMMNPIFIPESGGINMAELQQLEGKMPYILIQVTKEGVSRVQKQALIAGATELVVQVLGKDPATTFVVIDEVETDNWGVAGRTVTERRADRAS